MKANDIQIGGQHYKKAEFQPWDWDRYGVGGLEWTAIKYVTRYKDKGGVEDLKKAKHYVEKLIEDYKHWYRYNKLIKDSNKSLDQIEKLLNAYHLQNNLDDLQVAFVEAMLYWHTDIMLAHSISLIQDMIDAYSTSNVQSSESLESTKT